jgi:trehalose/maltose transport system substrate-binding protein
MRLQPSNPGDHSIDKGQFSRLSSLRRVGGLGVLLLAFASFGCRKAPEPVTLTYLDPEGLLDLGERHMISDVYLQEFTQETGIRVNHLPAPQDNGAQLRLAADFLKAGASTPDVYGVDTIWSGALSQYLIDLKPYFSSEMPSEDPGVLASYMVQGNLVAVPYHPNLGVLYYRTDLLTRYGYDRPPRTWDELEKMAVRIQNGERARGKKDFWGFIWPGTASESLSSMGMEWLGGEGGGRVIEADRKISVNNPNVIRAWERAAHWVGWISPPSTVSYTEWDASNAFWISGNAAFARGWVDYFERHPRGEPYRQKAGITSVPAGNGVRTSVLGGYALGISRFSAHRPEAVRLVKFLTDREAQSEAAYENSEEPRQVQLFELPAVLAKKYPWSEKDSERPGGVVVSRPSAVTGAKYDAVSRAYVAAVRTVLTHQSTGPAAAAALEKELIRITGYEVARK